jgi:hypothetical protein
MSSIAGMTPTGRKLIGPASDLIEVEDEDGVVLTALIYHSDWRQHPAITDALGVIIGFLESPLVTGLVELVGHEPEEGVFLYPTGSVRSVAEVVRMLSDRGERGGIRAGLELMYTAGQILVEGAESGESQGVYSHGGLTPRRVMIKEDGQVMVIGYGLPQVEILQFHANPSQVPREDSFRYCPPERIQARPEDLSSDLFGLALIAFEMMTGKPVYDGLVNDIRQQAARGEGSRRLFRFREVLPEPVRNLMTKVLRPDAEARYPDGEAFLTDVHTLLSDRSVPGPSLLDLMEELQSDKRRTGETLQQGSTQMVSADDLRSQLGGAPPQPAAAEEPGGGGAWTTRPNRGPAGAEAVEPAAVSPPAPSEPIAGDDDEAPPEAVVEPPEDTPKRWSKVRRQVRRVRRTTEALAPSAKDEDSTVDPPEELPPVVEMAAPPANPESPHPPAVPAPPQVPAKSRRPVRKKATPPVLETPPVVAPPQVPAQEYVGNSATDLLKQIRGRGKEFPAHRKLSEHPTAMFNRSKMVEVLDDASEDDGATVMMTPAQLREKLAANLGESEEKKFEGPSKGVTAPSAGGGEDAVLQLIAPDGSRHSVPVCKGRSVAAVVAQTVGDSVPFPLDQTGALEGWYRLEVDGKRVAPDLEATTLARQTCRLVWVPAATRLVEVCVNSGGKDVRFSNPMNTAVPVRSLVAHLQDWLALPPGDWCMHVGGRVLLGEMILNDLADVGELSVELRIRDS